MWRAGLDWLFPRPCLGCGREVAEADRHLCWDCRASLSYIQPPYCERCGDPIAGRVDHAFECWLCAGRRGGFDRARSVARYEGVVGEAIRSLKYHGRLWMIHDLADLLEAGVAAHYADRAFDLVTWVPLHPARWRTRGFNQAAELAKALARRLGLRAVSTTRRHRWTPSQTRLNIEERAANVRGAFRARRGGQRSWRGVRLLLVDDVMTTGATVDACASALKEGGALDVSVITVARG